MAVTLTEEWRPVVGESWYEVSSFGRVKSNNPNARRPDWYAWRILKLSPGNRGYLRVSFKYHGNARMVHHLVAEAFLGPGLGRIIHHRDGNPSNNHVDNLEWATPSQNRRHYLAKSSKIGKKLTLEKVRMARTLHAAGGTCADLARQFDVSASMMSDILQGRAWHEIPNVIECPCGCGQTMGIERLTALIHEGGAKW
jgi:hypothetical protein